MVRTFAKSENNSLTIQLPDDLIGKKLEIIAFEVPDDEFSVPGNPFKLKPSQLRGFLSKESAELIQQKIEQSRNEWDTL